MTWRKVSSRLREPRSSPMLIVRAMCACIASHAHIARGARIYSWACRGAGHSGVINQRSGLVLQTRSEPAAQHLRESVDTEEWSRPARGGLHEFACRATRDDLSWIGHPEECQASHHWPKVIHLTRDGSDSMPELFMLLRHNALRARLSSRPPGVRPGMKDGGVHESPAGRTPAQPAGYCHSVLVS